MKSVLGIITALLLIAVVAALVLYQTTHDSHLREVAFATTISLVSALLSMIPIWLARRAEPIVVFQAAFGGTIIHIFLTLALGGATYALSGLDRKVFIFLLLGLYWFSLILVVMTMIRIFRRATQDRLASVQAKGT